MLGRISFAEKHCLDKSYGPQTRAEAVGTGVFAPLNTVQVRFRGTFIEAFKVCPGVCTGSLNEVSASARPKIRLASPLKSCSLLSTCLILVLQYLIKPCVRGFGEMPTDHEFDAGELSVIVDDYNPGCNCLLLPCCYKRLTLTAKVTPFSAPALGNQPAQPLNPEFTVQV